MEDEFVLFDDEQKQDIFDGLNDKQKEAVEYLDGPILVLAGAGSGKTRVLTRRVANLILNHNIQPYQILAVTFTNKATKEMKERLSLLLGADVNSLWVYTFHAMSARILRKYADRLGYSNAFTIFDTQESTSVIKKIIKDLGYDDKKNSPESIRDIISKRKNALQTPQDIRDDIKKAPYSSFKSEYDQKLELAALVFEKYTEIMKEQNAMDFDDLLLNTHKLLRECEDVREYYKNKFQYILIDEFQDTNEVQYDIVKFLANERKNVFVVGDDDQSIYAFRGAKPSNIKSFEEDFKGTKVVKLEQNYRSTKNILSVSNSVIEKNTLRKGKTLWTEQDEGDLVTLYSALDENSESFFVAEEIQRLVKEEGYSYKDIACFYRTNAQSRALEEALMAHKIYYKIFGTLKFWDRKEIKDIVAYLRLLVNKNDNQAFLRIVNVPARGIGAQTVENLTRYAKEENLCFYEAAKKANNPKIQNFVSLMENIKEKSTIFSLPKLIEYIFIESKYKEKLKASKDIFDSESREENIYELITYADTISKGISDYSQALDFFMDKVALLGGDEYFDSKNVKEDDATDAVSLMTVHLAKGLEFPVVFFTGLEEGLVPHSRSQDSKEEIEEERRLCYVGMTRAMKKLYLSYAERRSSYRNRDMDIGYRKASRFLKDIPSKFIQRKDDYLYSNSKNDFFDEGESFWGFKRKNKTKPTYEEPSVYYTQDGELKKFNSKSSFNSSLQFANDIVQDIGNFRKLSIDEIKIGTKIRHPNFGDGIIRDIQGSNKTENVFKIKISVDFEALPEQKKLILAKAPLEIIEY